MVKLGPALRRGAFFVGRRIMVHLLAVRLNLAGDSPNIGSVGGINVGPSS
jgi:hypothetical protein